ncbi:YebC/PmpR family DNA-binding transcriptional regulator [Nosocomiicoccus ampullae]|uniref:Probable transcriptional regulatory protein HNQ45_000069 n=1 Tax=Nosocomiicoccus ampullae TaxID=489910 RepID=A0A9Q2HEU9_9STAP|nr:YebC/PmpR family DNA-binding transcriptional regulator [Nosocomiicoccus ampullae]MBB5175211.1 YebC/PmpR family DNA-binding regulatory protein [Nosocomiicoccus ampullae]QYA46412.1 YebC/PmpR family DNA-binding transcriptional regulator [Nosocomiicoccus ampullae]
MAGHSKWNNIKQRKGAQDKKRSKIFQKLSREIYMAAKQGGGDTDTNPALRLAMDRARAENMPKDNIKRAIDKATTSGAGEDYDPVMYEGYGPSGVGILTEALTDNRNRTNTNVRIAYNKNGGNIGEAGSVSYMFERKGYIAIERSTTDVDEDTMLMEVLEAGAEELETSEEVFEIFTEQTDFAQVRDYLEEEGFTLAQSELTMIPMNTVSLSDEDYETLENIIDALEDDDDVTDVHHNAVRASEE